MVITRYLRDTLSSNLCGCVGTPLELLLGIGSSVNQAGVPTGSCIAWNALPNKALQAGDYHAIIHFTVGTGGGSPNRVTCFLERRNNLCGLLDTIINVESGTLAKGATTTIDFEALGVGAITFGATDILVLRFEKTNGGQTTEIEYDGAGSQEDSLITIPNEVVAVGAKFINQDGALF